MLGAGGGHCVDAAASGGEVGVLAISVPLPFSFLWVGVQPLFPATDSLPPLGLVSLSPSPKF